MLVLRLFGFPYHGSSHLLYCTVREVVSLYGGGYHMVETVELEPSVRKCFTRKIGLSTELYDR